MLGNHIHLIIRPAKGESLSKIMQWILSVFARAWNKAHFVNGHVWGERFYSKIIEAADDFLEIFNYVSLNPVKAQLVKSAEEWEFGGIWHFISGETGILDISFCLERIYQEYCRSFYIW
ncbi:MAG: transposase [Dysgonamonadaceae bacterium]|jgi:putative transposase|nr:transposase [Dysgonamonadaceae bacterium]